VAAAIRPLLVVATARPQAVEATMALRPLQVAAVVIHPLRAVVTTHLQVEAVMAHPLLVDLPQAAVMAHPLRAEAMGPHLRVAATARPRLLQVAQHTRLA